MKRNSYKRLYGLLFAIMLVTAAIGSFYVYRQRKLQDRYAHMRSEGLEAARSGDDAAAIEKLGYYLQRNPNDAEVLYAYSQSRPHVPGAKNEHLRDTILALRSLLRLQPDRTSERFALIELYFKTGYLTEVVDNANYITTRSPHESENYVKALGKKVVAFARLRRFKEARALSAEWSQRAPQDVTSQTTDLWLMKQVSAATGDIIAAAQLKGKQNPADPFAQFMIGYAYRLTGDWSNAVSYYRQAAKAAPNSVEFGNALVDELNRVGLFEESLAVLQNLYAKFPTPELRNELGRRYWEVANYAEAVKMLEPIQPADAKADRDLLAIKALSFHELKQAAEAQAIQTALGNRKNDTIAQLWGMLLSQQFNSQSPNARQLADDCAKALVKEPGNLYLHYFSGDAHYRLGESDLAITEWETVATQNPTWSLPVMRLAMQFAELGRLEKAFDVAREAVERSPRSGSAVLTWVRIWAANIDTGRRKDTDALAAVVEKIQLEAPGEEESLAVYVALLGRAGKTAEAKKVLQKELSEKRSPSQDTLLRLAATSRAYKLELEAECFAKSEQLHGTSAALAFARAVDRFSAGKSAEGVTLLQAARKTAKDGDSFEWQLNEARFLELVRDDQAKAEVISLGDHFPKELRAQTFVENAHSTRGEREFLKRTETRLKELAGEQSLIWRVARARWIADFTTGAEDAEAITLLEDVVRRVPDQVEVRYMFARLYERSGKISDAITQLQAAADVNPNSVSVGLYLARLLQARGDFDRARAELERVASKTISDTDQRRQAAGLLAQQGEAQRAIDILEEDTRQSSSQGQADLLLASLYRQRNETQKAEAIYQKLLEKPEPAVIEFAADLMGSQGRLAEAHRLLAKLAELKTEPGQKELAEAEFAARYGDGDALALYRTAVKTSPTNLRAWQALMVYQLINQGAKAGDVMAINAEALKANPGEKTFQAISQHADFIEIAKSDVRLKILAASFLRDPGPGSASVLALTDISDAMHHQWPRDRLADRLAPLANRNARFLPLQLYLAELYLAHPPRPEESIPYAARATQVAPASADPFRIMAGGLAVAKRWGEAREVAQKWRDRSGVETLVPDVFIAECDMALERPAAALDRLQPYIGDPNKPGYGTALPVFARAQQAAGKGGAVALMEPLLKKGVQGRRAWMNYAVANLSATEAVIWLDRAAAEIPADATMEWLNIADDYGVLFSRTGQAAYATKARNILTPLLKSPAPSTEVVIACGSREEDDEHLPEAAVLYRRALAADPNSIVAKNNLAMVLAKSGGDLKESLSLAQGVVTLRPDIGAFHDTLSFVLLKAGKVDDALATMLTATRLEPDNVDYRVTLAEIYLAKKNMPQARATLRDIDTLKFRPEQMRLSTRNQLDAVRNAVKSVAAASSTN
jgi:lipopolysaccharide biosynthesis regulator YciM